MNGPVDTPVPAGMVWNMVYDAGVPAGTMPPVTPEQLWQRVGDFLDACAPVAEAAGVVLAAHPDDPPMPSMRGTPRLVHQAPALSASAGPEFQPGETSSSSALEPLRK